MKHSLLRKAAIQSLALMLAVVTLSYALKQYRMVTIEASDLTTEREDYLAEVVSEQQPVISEPIIDRSEPAIVLQPEKELSEYEKLLEAAEPVIAYQLSSNFLRIQKPDGSELSMQLEDLYINKSIRLTFEGKSIGDITSDMVTRAREGELFSGEPIYTETVTIEIDKEKGTSEEVITKDYGKDLSHAITITPKALGQQTEVLIELDSVYAYFIYEDENYYYIALQKPSEVYDRILVIDAGHGGKDAGALSPGEKFYEKNINLDILLQLKNLLDNENIKVYYTRTGDDKVFLRPRVQLANAVNCDYFISIHCNSSLSASPNGTEVLYYNNEFKGVEAYDLAKLFSEEIAKTIPLKNRGPVQKHYEDIFIMDKAKVPMILIEVGYLSNNSDLDFLSKKDNSKAIAQGIYNGIMRAYSELPVTE